MAAAAVVAEEAVEETAVEEAEEVGAVIGEAVYAIKVGEGENRRTEGF